MSSSPEEEPPRPLWTRDFLMHAATSSLIATGLYFFIASLPRFVVEVLNGSNTDIGLVIGLFSVSAVLVRPFIGFALDRYGRRVLQILAILLLTLVHTSFLLAASVVALLLLRFVHGIPWGIAQTAVSTAAADMIPEERRGEGLGMFGLTFTLAGAIGPMLCLLLLDATGFATVFLVGSGLTLVAVGTSLATRFPQVERRTEGFSFRRILEPAVVGIAIATLLSTMSFGAIVSFITLYVKEYQLPTAGWYFTMSSIGTIVTRVRAGALFDRHGPRQLLFAGQSSLVVSLLLLGLFPETWAYHLSAFLLGAGFGINVPTWQSMAINLVPATRRGGANATLFSAFDVGIATGSLGLGLISEFVGLRWMYVIEGVLLVLPLLFFLHKVIPEYEKKRGVRVSL